MTNDWRNFHLTIAYDGSDFFGYQFQPELRTVQGVLEQAMARVAEGASRAVGSGRTDRGVHALGQAISFSLQTRLDTATLQRALNAHLPDDVTILEVAEVADNFNAISCSTGKRYRYVIDDGPQPDIFSRRHAWHLRHRLDVSAMQQASEALLGQHDFKSYESSGSRRVNTVRTVRDLVVQRAAYPNEAYQTGERVLIEVEADGFLYNMVRNLVGTLVAVGRGRQPSEWPYQILAEKDRRLAGMTAPAQGLYLVQVFF